MTKLKNQVFAENIAKQSSEAVVIQKPHFTKLLKLPDDLQAAIKKKYQDEEELSDFIYEALSDKDGTSRMQAQEYIDKKQRKHLFEFFDVYEESLKAENDAEAENIKNDKNLKNKLKDTNKVVEDEHLNFMSEERDKSTAQYEQLLIDTFMTGPSDDDLRECHDFIDHIFIKHTLTDLTPMEGKHLEIVRKHKTLLNFVKLISAKKRSVKDNEKFISYKRQKVSK